MSMYVGYLLAPTGLVTEGSLLVSFVKGVRCARSTPPVATHQHCSPAFGFASKHFPRLPLRWSWVDRAIFVGTPCFLHLPENMVLGRFGATFQHIFRLLVL